MRVLDLFSGIGGIGLGLERAGMELVAFCERRENARLVLKKHWPHLEIFTDIDQLCRRTYDNTFHNDEYVECSIHNGEDFGDCECIGTDQFLDTYGAIDLVAGGPPCQPYSRNGKRAGRDDDRHKWPEMYRVINELQPGWVLFENVAGAVEQVSDEICSDLEKSGYRTFPFCVEAGSFGAEHHRERLFVVANNKGIRMEGMWSEGVKIPQPLDHPFLPLRDSNGEWEVEPDLRRGPYGLSTRLDGRVIRWGDRLELLGEAVCPQVAEIIGTGILMLDGSKENT